MNRGHYPQGSPTGDERVRLRCSWAPPIAPRDSKGVVFRCSSHVDVNLSFRSRMAPYAVSFRCLFSCRVVVDTGCRACPFSSVRCIGEGVLLSLYCYK